MINYPEKTSDPLLALGLERLSASIRWVKSYRRNVLTDVRLKDPE